MKLPAISKDSLLNLLLQHGEKVVVAGVALLAMGLAWGGVNAIRHETVTPGKRPEALASHASRTLQHIDREKKAPADVAPKTPLLTKLVEPWRTPKIAPPPDMALLDRPLYEELARRTKPEVFPVEELRAVAGLAVLAAKDPAAGGGRPAEAAADSPKKKPPKGGKKGAMPDDPLAAMPQFGGGGPPGMGGDGAVQMPRGQIVPYIVVTGLIPVAKQADEYGRRFQSTSLRDEKRDSPLWSDYLVERSTVVPGGRETWDRIDLKAVAKRAREQWAGLQGEPLPPDFLLSAEQTPGMGGIVYCAPLPQLAMQGWGPESIHPWVRRELERLRAEREAEEKAARERGEAGGDQSTEPGFESPLAERPDQPGPEAFGPGRGVDAAGRPVNRIDYRLFRFVDTSVEPGKSYRYRVRLSVWNPNYNVPAQHLADAALAKEAKLPSPSSNVTDPVTIPEKVNVLVRTLPKEDMKRFKPGMVEVLVLGPDERTGNYSLRGVITDLGGLVNVDTKLNKTGDQRTRGEEIFTDGVIVDMIGRQEDREDLKTPKNVGPPEPLELLVMRPDGRFNLVSAAASEESVTRYLGTLPFEPKAAKKAADDEPPPGEPGRPFSFPGIGPR